LTRGGGALAAWALAAALGALHSLPFVWTWAWPLQLACVAALAWMVRDARPQRAAGVGFAFGMAWLLAGVWWLFISMHRYGGLAAPLAAAAVALLCAAMALYLAAAFGLFAVLRRGRPGADALLFGAVWLAAELARGVLFTGFPWLASGYAHIDAPLAALAPWVGVYGIGFVAAWAAALLAFAAAARRLVSLAVAVALVGAPAAIGAGEHTRGTATLSVTLLQTNIPQDEKFAADRLPQTLQTLHDDLAAARGDLVVAPETAIPLLPEQLGPDYWNGLKARFEPGGQAALVGLPLGTFETGYTNSAAGLSAGAARLPGGFYRYDKVHLVPFGEFIPAGFRWFTELMHIPLGDFARGPLAAPSFDVRGERIAPNICYEDLFGEELAVRFGDPRRAPTVFANLSNIGWFGDTIAIDQHLHISRMRTLEFQRPMLRATNTGATAIIDHRGQVVAALASYTRGMLEGRVEGRDGLTPYARWASRAGLAPLAGLALLVVAAAAARARRSRRRAPART
jgi:apolipoprotein N-acyltransferase